MRAARPGRRAVGWGVGLGLLLAGPQLAGARERPQVALTIEDCVAVEREQVRHLLSLELGGPLADAGTPAATTRAAVGCPARAESAAAPPQPGPPLAVPSPPPAASAATLPPELTPGLPPRPEPPSAEPPSAEPPSAAPPRPETPSAEPPSAEPPRPPLPPELLTLRVDDAVTGKSLWRSIELQPADPGVRARLLSLALSELIFASWAELLVTPEPAVPAATPAASAATRQATSVQVERKLPRPQPPLGVQLSGLGAAFVLWGEPAVCFGGGARVTGDHLHHLGWDFDVLLQHGATATVLGTVDRDLLSARAALLFHQRVPYLILRGGVGGRLGAAKLTGEPADAKTTLSAAVWGPWGGPLLTLGLSAAAARLRLDLSLEAGYVVSPVAARVGGVRAVAIGGTWFGIQLGIGSFLR